MDSMVEARGSTVARDTTAAAGAIEAAGTVAAGDIAHGDVEGRADALPFFLMASLNVAINSLEATG
jgi:hypothetical protein